MTLTDCLECLDKLSATARQVLLSWFDTTVDIDIRADDAPECCDTAYAAWQETIPLGAIDELIDAGVLTNDPAVPRIVMHSAYPHHGIPTLPEYMHFAAWLWKQVNIL